MLVCQLKSKIHRAMVTRGDVEYEGSIEIPQDLVEAEKFVHHTDYYDDPDSQASSNNDSSEAGEEGNPVQTPSQPVPNQQGDSSGTSAPSGDNSIPREDSAGKDSSPGVSTEYVDPFSEEALKNAQKENPNLEYWFIE